MYMIVCECVQQNMWKRRDMTPAVETCDRCVISTDAGFKCSENGEKLL